MSRNPEYTIDRTFYRGEVYFIALPPEPELEPDDSYILFGDHRVIVLYDSESPRKTVTVAPITSLFDKDGNRKETIITDLILNKEDYDDTSDRPYRGTIKEHSFVKTEQTRAFSRHYLERKVGKILPEDMINLDLRLIATFHLQDTVSKLIEAEVQKVIAQLETEEAN